MIEENNNVHYLNVGDKKIILVGTAHISHKSVALVKEVIETEKPDAVGIELCPSRYEAMESGDRWKNMNLFKIIREKKTVMLIVNLLLASFQRKLAKQFNITPGAEMKQAINSANELGASIVLIDRNIRTTLLRIINSISFCSKLKLMGSGFGSFLSKEEISQETIDELTNGDQLAGVLDAMDKNSPDIKKVIITERDLYMIEKIRQTSAKKIVAVVGAGHIPGMKKNLTNTVNIEELEIIPPKSKIGTLIKWLIPILIIAMFVGGFIIGGTNTLTELGIIWIISNGLFCLLGAIIAFAHPVTIIASIFVAPITSLNPMIGAGMVCGLIELFFRKPKVKEMERVLDDIETFSGWRKNPITKVLLVVITTSMGSAIGTFVSIKLFADIL